MRRRVGQLPVAGLAIVSIVLAACGGGAPTSAPAVATQGAGAASTVAAVAPTLASIAPTLAAEVAPTVVAAATEAAPAVATVGAAAATVVSGAPTSATGAATGKTLRVGLVTDVGKIDDKSFNQSAWEGVQRAGSELGAEVKFIESTDPKDYAKNIEQFAEDGYDVIVTVGFALGKGTLEAAEQYPDIKFIGVDQFQAEEVANVAGLIFPEDRAGYLAGALAAHLSKTGTIGQVLGTPVVPPVEAFGVGYIAGARATKADIKVLSACHPGGLAKGFSDPEWGKTTTTQIMDQKADVIFAAGGQTGNGGLLAIAERKDSGVLGIGVDSDQYFTLEQARPILVTSAMKLITPGVFEVIKSVQDGSFKGGNAVGEVGLAPYHDVESKVPAEVKASMQQLDAEVKAGNVETGWGAPTGECPKSV